MRVPWYRRRLVRWVFGEGGWLACSFCFGMLAEPTLALVAEALQRGKWTHLGRVNTKGRLLAAAAAGVYRSADGTKLGFGDRRNLPELVRWLAEAEHQPGLWKALP